MFQTKVVEKIRTHILRLITFFFFFWKSCLLWDNVKYCRAGQAADDSMILCVHFACWIAEGTDTHAEYVILITFPRWQRWCEPASLLLLYVHCLSCYLQLYPCDKKERHTHTCLCFKQTLFILCAGNAYQIKLWQLFSGFFHLRLILY